MFQHMWALALIPKRRRKKKNKKVSYVSHVMCHVSCVRCQVSCVTCQVSLFSIFFSLFSGLSGGASWWEVCYEQGLPRLVSIIFRTQQLVSVTFSWDIVMLLSCSLTIGLQAMCFRVPANGNTHSQASTATYKIKRPWGQFSENYSLIISTKGRVKKKRRKV